MTCGVLFDTPHDVQRHIKCGWCPENNDEILTKKSKLDESSDGEQDEDLEENATFNVLWKSAKKSNENRFSKIVDQAVKDGEEKTEATELAEDRVKPYDERASFIRYESLIPLQNSALHQTVVTDAKTLISKGLNQTSVI